MRKLAVLLVVVAVIPTTAWAFNADDLLGTIAMPLAVAAVADVPGVPASTLSQLVTTLNRANVPPVQFVEVIRYVPVALVTDGGSQDGGPTFVRFVEDQTDQGVTGNALVDVIAERLRTQYDISPTLSVTAPATSFVVEESYIPTVVKTRVATLYPQTQYGATLTPYDPLALIAMPLAVAAASQITGVPQDELANFVAALNQANVPPVQVVEVLRYVPVALAVDDGQPFLTFVHEQTTRGIVGPALTPVIVEELRTYYPPDTQITVSAPAPQRTIIAEGDFVPQFVATRVQEVRAHPHGGPPGQLKKQLGLQTGAEVVHGAKPGHAKTAKRVHTERVTAPPPMMSSSPAPRKSHAKHEGKHPTVVVPRAPAPAPVAVAPPANPPGHGNGNAKGHGHDGGAPKQPKGNGGGGKKHGKG